MKTICKKRPRYECNINKDNQYYNEYSKDTNLFPQVLGIDLDFEDIRSIEYSLKSNFEFQTNEYLINKKFYGTVSGRIDDDLDEYDYEEFYQEPFLKLNKEAQSYENIIKDESNLLNLAPSKNTLNNYFLKQDISNNYTKWNSDLRFYLYFYTTLSQQPNFNKLCKCYIYKKLNYFDAYYMIIPQHKDFIKMLFKEKIDRSTLSITMNKKIWRKYLLNEKELAKEDQEQKIQTEDKNINIRR